MGTDPTLDQPLASRHQRVWEFVSRFPLRSLWNLQGIPSALWPIAPGRPYLGQNFRHRG